MFLDIFYIGFQTKAPEGNIFFAEAKVPAESGQEAKNLLRNYLTMTNQVFVITSCAHRGEVMGRGRIKWNIN